MAYTKAILFDINSQSANYGKIVSSITDVSPINTRNVYYKVVGPLSDLRLPNFASPDGTLSIGVPTASMPLVNIPVNTDGTYQEGIYSIIFYIEDQSLIGTYDIQTSTFALDIKKQGDTSCRFQARIGFKVDCHCYIIQINDETTYDAEGVTLITRQLDIVLPTIPPSVIPPTPLSTPNSSITFNFGYSGVYYTVNLYSVYEHYYNNGEITVQEDLIATKTELIKCDFNLCGLLKCIAEKFAEINEKARKLGGLSKLPAAELDKFLLVQEYLYLLQAYLNCGDYFEVDKYYQLLKELLHCKCGCSDGNTQTPTAVNPACGTTLGSILSIVANPPLQANQVGQTVTIQIDPAYLAALNASIAAALANITTTTPTYLDITTPSPGVWQINFLAVWTAYITLTNAQALAGVIDFDTTPVPIRYRINAVENAIQIDGSFKLLIGSPGTCMTQTALPFAITRQGPRLPVFDGNTIVGAIQLLIAPLSSTTDIVFYPNANYITGSIGYVNGTLPIN